MSKRKSDDEATPEAHYAKRRKGEANRDDETALSEAKRLKKQEKRKKKTANVESKLQSEQSGGNAGTNGNDAVLDKQARRRAKEAKRARKAAKLAAALEIQDIESSTAIKSEVNGQSTIPDGQRYVVHTDLGATAQADIDAYLQEHDIKYVDSTSGRQNLRPITKFEYLPGVLAKADLFKNFESPTPVQASTWPYMLNERDVIGVAETGSGKTLAFGIPCMQRISVRLKQGHKGIQAVIVSPTRELASQIYDQLKLAAGPQKIKVCCVYGGVPKDHQREQLRGAHIVVATPGRLNDFLQEGSADLSTAEFACLDEADRMLDKGFEDDIRKILGATAPAAQRQTVMFTATWPQSVRDLAGTFMHDPVQIYIGRDVKGDLQANIRIEQKVEVMDPKAKDQRLYQILRESQRKDKKDRVLIFCLYKKEATRVENNIRYKGFNVAGIHGDMTQQKRMESLEAFKSGQVPYLVATDVAARGLDIPAVKLVLNMTFPLTAEDYVHRIGRTGRAGQHGKAITFFTEHEKHLSGALINVLKSAHQPVPDELLKFGTTVKKKEHAAYGAFFKDVDTSKKATKITFE